MRGNVKLFASTCEQYDGKIKRDAAVRIDDGSSRGDGGTVAVAIVTLISAVVLVVTDCLNDNLQLQGVQCKHKGEVQHRGHQNMLVRQGRAEIFSFISLLCFFVK